MAEKIVRLCRFCCCVGLCRGKDDVFVCHLYAVKTDACIFLILNKQSMNEWMNLEHKFKLNMCWSESSVLQK